MKGPLPKAPKPKTISEKIVSRILDKSLANSTWRDNYPEAYDDLVRHYRPDIVEDVRKVMGEAADARVRRLLGCTSKENK